MLIINMLLQLICNNYYVQYTKYLTAHAWTHQQDIGENTVMFMTVLLVQMDASSQHDLIQGNNF